MLLTPNSILVFATCFIAGWNSGAKRNPMPIRLMHVCTVSGEHCTFTPKAVSTSALPLLLVTDLLPCFATVTPAPATTKDDTVDMLNVPSPSPPVPHMSIASESSIFIRTPRSRSIWANPTSSFTVSPFARRATSNPPICASVAFPVNIISSAIEDSSTVRSEPDKHFSICVFI